jgi:hypothetical protein
MEFHLGYAGAGVVTTKITLAQDGTHIRASLIPALDFSWKSDPLANSNVDFAVIGDEANGRYYGRLMV